MSPLISKGLNRPETTYANSEKANYATCLMSMQCDPPTPAALVEEEEALELLSRLLDRVDWVVFLVSLMIPLEPARTVSLRE